MTVTRVVLVISLLFVFSFSAFSQTESASQTESESLADSAKNLAYHQQYEQAMILINKAVELSPSNAKVYLKRGKIYYWMGNNIAAREDTLMAVSLNPDDINFLEWCVKQLNETGDYKSSLDIAERLIASKVKESVFAGYRMRYKTRYSSGDFKGTIEDVIKNNDYHKAFYEGQELYIDEQDQTRFTDGLLIDTLNKLNEEGDYLFYFEKILEFINRKREVHSSIGSLSMKYRLELDLYTAYAVAFEKIRTPDETKIFFDKIAKNRSLAFRAEIFTKMKKYEFALADLTEFLKTTPHKSTYFVIRGDLFMLMEQFNKALADYEIAKSFIKDDFDFYNEKINKAKRKLAEKKN